MSEGNIASIQKILRLSGTIQQDIISTLSKLSGYSKRRELLEALLRNNNHSVSGISQSIDRMLSVGLLAKKQTEFGARVSLIKEVWNEEPKIVEAIFRVAQLLGKGRKSNTHSGTVISEVRSKLAERLGSFGSQKLFQGVVNAALLTLPDWELLAGKIARTSATSNLPTLFDNRKKKPGQSPSTSGAKHALPNGLEFLVFDSKSIAKNLKEELSKLRMKVEAKENFCIVSASLPFGRKQEVFISMRSDPMKRRVFWLYTLCGELNKGDGFLKQALLENNNECGPMHVTVFQIGEQSMLGCCASISADTGWEKELPQVALLLSNLGDQLEEKFWEKDRF